MKGSGLLTILDPPPSQPCPLGLAEAELTVPDDFNAPWPEAATTDCGSRSLDGFVA